LLLNFAVEFGTWIIFKGLGLVFLGCLSDKMNHFELVMAFAIIYNILWTQ
jgi:hypothetical protein